MKKTFILILLSLSAMTVDAQQRREVRLPDAPPKPNYKNYDMEDKGFWCAADIEAGSSTMFHHKNMQYTNVSATSGYRLNEYLRFGAGIGLRYYANNADIKENDDAIGFLYFGNVRGNMMASYDRDGVPFWSVNFGSISTEGAFISPTLGYSMGGLRHNIQVGLSYTLSTFTNHALKKVTYNNFGIKVGYEF